MMKYLFFAISLFFSVSSFGQSSKLFHIIDSTAKTHCIPSYDGYKLLNRDTIYVDTVANFDIATLSVNNRLNNQAELYYHKTDSTLIKVTIIESPYYKLEFFTFFHEEFTLIYGGKSFDGKHSISAALHNFYGYFVLLPKEERLFFVAKIDYIPKCKTLRQSSLSTEIMELDSNLNAMTSVKYIDKYPYSRSRYYTINNTIFETIDIFHRIYTNSSSQSFSFSLPSLKEYDFYSGEYMTLYKVIHSFAIIKHKNLRLWECYPCNYLGAD